MVIYIDGYVCINLGKKTHLRQRKLSLQYLKMSRIAAKSLQNGKK